jgi:hypothetical protein
LKRLSACFACLAIGLSACTYPVESTTTEPEKVFMAYTDRVPGKWALLIDSDKATGALVGTGIRCDQFKYPVDFTKTVARIAEATFKTVGDDIRVSDHQLTKTELASGGYTGVIIVRIIDFRPKIDVDGVLEPHADATTEIDGTVLVTKGGQRMVDSSESAKGDSGRDAGIACEGAADAVSAASDQAVQDIVRKFAEEFANSHAVRYSVPGSAPQN